MLRQYLLLPLVIAAAIILAVVARIPPSSVAETGFETQRAKADVAALAIAPRPVGSKGHAEAQAYLVQRFEAMGLETVVRGGIGVRQANFDKWRKGAVSVSPYTNIIAILPGQDRTKQAVMLMAHYDSVPWTYGASDDAAGVAALLETARVLAKGQRPLRDTIFLVTDAEELGMIGAQEFFDGDPLAENVGAVVNVEARGSRGRAIMFQTSDGNAALVDLWARSASDPTGNSLAKTVYLQLPNDTDLSIPLKKNRIGINAAFIDGLADYHMPTDNAENIDLKTLGDLGSFALTTTRALANETKLPAKTVDVAYFDVFGQFVIRYPLNWGWGLVVLGCVGLGFVGISRMGVSWADAGKAMLGVFGLTLGTGAAIHFLMQWTSGSGTQAFLDRINEMDNAMWIFIAAVAGAVLVTRPRKAMWVGGVMTCLLLALLSQYWLPGGSWIFIWAALLGIAMLALAAQLGAESPWVVYGSAVAGTLWGALLLAGLISTYVTVAPVTPVPMILIIPLSLALLGPVLIDASISNLGRKVGVALLTAAAAGMAWVGATDHFSERHPKPADLFHVTDGDGLKSWWATSSSAKLLPKGNVENLKLPGFGKLGWKGVSVSVSDFSKPDIAFSELSGRMVLTTASAKAPRALSVILKPHQALSNVTVNGKPVKLPQGKSTRVSWRAETPNAKLEIAFNKVGAGKLDLHYLYALPGLPDNAPRRDGVRTDWTYYNESRVVWGFRPLDW
jgi:Peptidase family M28